MLPKPHKLGSSADFRRILATRIRAGSTTLVVHLSQYDEIALRGGPRFGLVVSKAVGNAVTRHAVSRKLRHILFSRVDKLDADLGVVVRALPASAEASSEQLERDFDAAFASAHAKLRKKMERQ